jgi:hypothetical protein
MVSRRRLPQRKALLTVLSRSIGEKVPNQAHEEKVMAASHLEGTSAIGSGLDRGKRPRDKVPDETEYKPPPQPAFDLTLSDSEEVSSSCFF